MNRIIPLLLAFLAFAIGGCTTTETRPVSKAAEPASDASIASRFADRIPLDLPQLEPDMLTFAWPADSAPKVRHVVDKNGQQMAFHYELQILPHETDKFAIVHRDIHVAAADQETKLPEQLPFFPSIVIDEAGALEELLFFDEQLEFYREQFGHDKQLMRFFESEEGQFIIASRSLEFWCDWICNWIDTDFSSANPVFAREPMNYFGAEAFDNAMYTYHGESKQYPGAIHLSYVSETDSEEAEKLIEGVIRSMRIDRSKFDLEEMKSLTKTITVHAHLIPFTMQPIFVSREVRTKAGERERLEQTTYQFTWDVSAVYRPENGYQHKTNFN